MADKLNLEALQGYYEKAIAAAKPHLPEVEITSLAANAMSIAVEYAKEHPYSTTFAVIKIGLIPVLGPGWMTAPLLRMIGFTPLGPIAGGLAAWYQSTFLGGYIPANSLFAAAQRAAMG